MRTLAIGLLALCLIGCEVSARELSNGLLNLLSRITGAGPDEVGLSPGKRRPHALPLNNPSFVPAANATHMRPKDLVVGVVVNGQPRAYPWWVVRNYHVINDTVVVNAHASRARAVEDDDFWTRFERIPPPNQPLDRYIPLFVTLCEACSGASAFIPASSDSVNRPLVFSQCRSKGSWAGDYSAVGVYTICDLQTHSRWHPFTGEARSGPLKGQRMQRIPVSVERWDEWVKRYPDTRVVLAGEELRLRTHARLPGAEMGGQNLHPTFRRWVAENPGKEDTRLGRNTLVLGISARDRLHALAYPLSLLREMGGVVQHEFAGEPYLFVVGGSYRAAAFHRRLGQQKLSFEVASREPLLLRDGSGTLWNELGEAIEGPHSGKRLPVVADSYLAEWFDWVMEHPGSEIVTR